MALTPKGTGILVKGPRCATPPKYGLLSVADPINSIDLHWTASGIEWEDFLCTPGVTGFIDNCPPASGFTKPAERNNLFCQADPFIVVGSYDCSTGGRPINEAFEVARQRLLSWEQRTVEEILWTGQSANGVVNPSFAFGNDVCGIFPEDLAGGAGSVDAVSAIAQLENALGDRLACEGVIHVPYGFAAYLLDHRLLERVGDEYFTPTGYRVVLGQGYTGSGPGNVPATPGTTWLYGTGPLLLARSNVIMVPENINESVNRINNDVTVRAERFYAVGFSCALVAINVNLSCACC
jgi:hypothetical protein